MTTENESEFEPIEPNLMTEEDAEQKMEQAIELACDDNGEVIDLETFHDRLRNEYGMEVDIVDGERRYGQIPEEIQAGWVFAHHSVLENVHPAERGIDVERENEFSRQVTEVFNQQLKEAHESGDDPFPLRASVDDSNVE